MGLFRPTPAAVVIGLVALAACRSESPPAAAAFEVVRVMPPLGGRAVDEPEPLYLNQEVSIRFSAEVDPLSITEDTVRMTDDRGRRVVGRLRTRSHTVIFEPVAPLEPSLEDGSFKPGQSYRLEVVGFPRAGAVRSAAGEVLETSVAKSFRAVAVDHQPSPLLHSPSVIGFALERTMLRMAESSRTLSLSFYEPPLPTTVRPEAFVLHRGTWEGASPEFEAFAPVDAKLHRLPPSPRGLPSWVVELTLDRSPGFALAVELVDDPAHALCNYRGDRPRLLTLDTQGEPTLMDLTDEKVTVDLYQGERVPLVQDDFQPGQVFPAARFGRVGFEVRERRAVPRTRVLAGSGRLGVLRPSEDTVIELGGLFDPGDGRQLLAPRAALPFADVHIPDGVTVIVRSPAGGPVRVLSAGSIRIDGRLLLDGTPLGMASAPINNAPDDDAADIVDAAGVVLVAAADIDVRGRIERQGAAPELARESPLTLLSGGDIRLGGGTLPPGTRVLTEVGRALRGENQGTVVPGTVVPMALGVPPGVAFTAEAATPWYPLPPSRHGQIEIDAVTAGDLRVFVEVAPADPTNDRRPSRDASYQPQPVPLAAPLSVPPGGFLRLLLEGRVESGKPLPSLAGFTVLGV